MSKPIQRPTCSFRISLSRLRLLMPGLRKLVTEMANVRAKIETMLILPRPKCNLGAYSKTHHGTLRQVWTRLNDIIQHPPECNKVRLDFDLFAISTCQLAGRLSRQLADSRRERRAISTLLKQLETWRRRAARRYVQIAGRRSYTKASRHWRQFMRWIRTHALARIPGRFLQGDSTGSRRRYMPKRDHLLVAAAMEQARRELTNRGELVPEEPQLRRLIRAAFRKVRRSRHGCGTSIRDLVSKRHGAEWLGEYILRKTGVIKS